MKNFKKLHFKMLTHLPAAEKRITWATVCTLLRILLTPFIVYLMIVHVWNWALFLFSCAAITDVLDGVCARFFNEKTFLGACLDPIADKFLLISCFSTLAFVEIPPLFIPGWFVLFVVSKELIQIIGALLIFGKKGYIDICPTMLGKMSTFIQMIFIMWLFSCYFFHWLPIKTYYIMFGMVIISVAASFVQYVSIGIRMFFRKEKIKN